MKTLGALCVGFRVSWLPSVFGFLVTLQAGLRGSFGSLVYSLTYSLIGTHVHELYGKH